MGQPGEKIDLSTFIAYLLPGFIIESIIFSAFDCIYLLINKISLLDNVWNIDVPKLLIIGTLLAVAGYFLGTILDMFAHIFTGKDEQSIKIVAYQEVFFDLQQFITDDYRDLLSGTKKEEQNKRSTFIDAMFYHYATSDHWSRQNWSWSFYEASRNFVILLLPTFFFLSFYGVLTISIKSGLNIIQTLLISSLIATLITITGWRLPYKKLREYRNVICQVYHRHRAFVVFSVLMDKTLFEQK